MVIKVDDVKENRKTKKKCKKEQKRRKVLVNNYDCDDF